MRTFNADSGRKENKLKKKKVQLLPITIKEYNPMLPFPVTSSPLKSKLHQKKRIPHGTQWFLKVIAVNSNTHTSNEDLYLL